jgi:hypothetical protein
MTKIRSAVRAWFKTSENRTAQITPLPALFPRTVAPVVRLASDGERELVQMTVGLSAHPERLCAKARDQRSRRYHSDLSILASEL